MNKHPINHVFQGIKYHNLVAQKPDIGLACYKCYSEQGNPCSLDPSNPDLNILIKSCYQVNDGSDCLSCSDSTPKCHVKNSCLSGQ
jgi:hypothetical protein